MLNSSATLPRALRKVLIYAKGGTDKAEEVVSGRSHREREVGAATRSSVA
jgi:hypothetical protein